MREDYPPMTFVPGTDIDMRRMPQPLGSSIFQKQVRSG